MKRKLSLQSLLSSDTDSDTDFEAEIKLVRDIQSRIDMRVKNEESKKPRIDEVEDGSANSIQNVGALHLHQTESVSTMKIKAEVHADQEGIQQPPDADFCEVVKVVPPPVAKKVEPELRDVVPSPVVVGKSKKGVVPAKEPAYDIIVISSDDACSSDEAESDDSFSPNQEGSRRVQTLMFEQELGKELNRIL